MSDTNIYLGVWTNWSNGTVMGSTLTTTRKQGDLLIAFTAFLVPFVASRFWIIFCLAFHQFYSTSESRDALHHQRQVILRNSSSPDSGLMSLFSLLWAWRKSANRLSSRLFPVILFAICCISAFTIAGGLSSQISSAPGNEVLINGNQCGVAYWPNSTIEGGANTKPYSRASSRFNDAANYAQQCYSSTSSGLLDCDKFVVKTLPTAITKNDSSCPFQGNICRSNDTNLLLDTGYIDSNDELGLNYPENQRFGFRYVLQCAPLITQGYTYQVTLDNTTWVRYNYGSLDAGNTTLYNYTYEIEDLDSQYYASKEPLFSGANYRLGTARSAVFEGKPLPAGSEFTAIPQLFRADGDTSIMFLSGNGLYFNGPMDDDWYRATAYGRNLSFENSPYLGAIEGYRSTEAASPLGCLEQWQWCNSAYPRESGCGPLASQTDAVNGALPLFNLTTEEYFASQRPSSPTASGTRLIWPTMLQNSGASDVPDMIEQLGAKSLSSQSLIFEGIQEPLPQNQWHLDVTNWWNTVLALVQAVYVDTAIGSTDPDLLQSQYPPLNAEERKVCNSQKIRNSAYASFSLFGLLFTYITGIIIILISVILEPIIACVQKKRQYKQYSYLEWTTNSNLQLHRIAQEELNLGTWSHCTDRVPITDPCDILANLDISNLEHPVFTRPDIMVKQETKYAGSTHHDELQNITSISKDPARATQSSMEKHTSVETSSADQEHGPNNGNGVPATIHGQTAACSLTNDLMSMEPDGNIRGAHVSHSSSGLDPLHSTDLEATDA